MYEKDKKKSGTLYLVGVGPGDPELLTLKGARVLEKCAVWFAPKANAGGGSSALGIAEKALGKPAPTVITHHFPMKQVFRKSRPEPELQRAWQEAAWLIAGYLSKGQDVAFPTLGDPAVYSTAFYVHEALHQHNFDAKIKIIPGVSAIGASSAAIGLPLCLGDEHLAVIPATFTDEKIAGILASCDAAALMKVHRVLPKIISLLDKLDLTEKAVLVERAGFEDQKIWHHIKEIKNHKLHYFSTLIIRK